jgi:putative SOS response-associated peptidase YedK
MLDEAGEQAWLDPDATEEQLLALLRPYPVELMPLWRRWRVSFARQQRRNNFPELLKPVAEVG